MSSGSPNERSVENRHAWIPVVSLIISVFSAIGSVASAIIFYYSLQKSGQILAEAQNNNQAQVSNFLSQQANQRTANAQQEERHDTILRAQLFRDSVTYSTKIDELLLREPELRQYVYGGKDITEGHKDYDKFTSLADTVIDVFDMVLFSNEIKDAKGQPGWPGQIGWRNWMRDIWASSPGLRRYYEIHQSWYEGNPALKKLYDEAVEQVKRQVPPQPVGDVLRGR